MLERFIPGFLIKVFAGPYVAGDSLEAGLAVADKLARGQGVHATLDLLAEGITTEAQVRENVRVYEEMIRAVAGDPRFAGSPFRPTISLKPSSYTLSPLTGKPGDTAAGSAEHVTHLVALAAEHGVQVTVDMEDRHWTDFTLDLVNRLWADGHRNLGTVLQTRMKRCAKDLERIPAGMRLRLVIGIYREPAEVALTDKPAMKQLLLDYGEELLRRNVYVELATHDEAVIRRFLAERVARAGKGPDECEVQMLYGVPRQRLISEIQKGGLLTREGRVPKVRLYTPFATSWPMATAYCRRRFMENPHMALYVMGNLVQKVTRRRSAC